MHGESDMLDPVLAAPDDHERRLIYADWLEEHGDPRGDYLRAAMTLEKLENEMPAPSQRQRWLNAVDIGRLKRTLRNLATAVDAGWAARIHRGCIQHCNWVFESYSTGNCPRLWHRLPENSDRFVRHCDQCSRDVWYCQSQERLSEALLSRHPVVLGCTMNR